MAQQTYFQQELNYTITVSLNDQNHSLSAFEKIQYINNSDKGIEFIYFHLWPNAYKSTNTALAKQLVRLGKTDFYFSKEEERGFIDSLDFKVDGKSVKLEYDKENPDICKILLEEPLKSLDTILISTPFHVKIPDAKFSRMGHVNQAYFITQWYPKPAVYDRDGWHQMPYLDQGEFYSEFGSFDVSITLPQNYLLSATGDRINAVDEENFLNDRVAKTIERLEKKDYRANEMAFPPSSPIFKTVKFKQYRVHDFAWFADKRFNVLHDQFELPNSKRIVDSWTFFTNRNFDLWKNSIDYVNESTIFYSYLIGDYPYNHVTAVDGTIMAGGGMEYPNITVIGQMTSPIDLDITIAHEVGHNWFYGILGNNERDAPAMDEGLNSLYEMRYCRAKYPAIKLTQYFGRDSTFKLLGANKIPFWKEKEVGYTYSAREGTDQPINTKSDDFTKFNYGSIVYAKTAVSLDYLMQYMGEGSFDKAMQFYFDQYKFKHPNINDLANTLNHFNGSEMNWFFKNLMQTNDKIDYKVKSIYRLKDGSFDLKIKNKTNFVTPFNIYAFKKNKVVGYVWSNGFPGTKKVSFPTADADYFRIDGLEMIPEINRKNNGIRASGLFKKAKAIQLNFITKIENPRKTQINYLPIIGGNFYNGPMLGMAIHNYGLYQKKFEYCLSPMFALKSMSPAGLAEFNYNIHPKKIFQQITFGTKSKFFAYNIYDTKPYNLSLNTNYKSLNLQYLKIAPYLLFEIKKAKANSNTSQFISYTSNNLFTEVEDTDSSTYRTFATNGPKKKSVNYFVNELAYELINKTIINPYNFRFSLEHNDKIAKVSATFNYKYTFSKTHDFSVRAFAGTFITGSDFDKGPYAFRMSGYNGYHDYAFNDNFVARNETYGFGFSQFSERDGAMKVWTPLGQSTQWLASLNLKSPRLFILPVKIFVDISTCDGRSLNNDKILWAAGANIVLWKDIIDIYIPVSYSKDIQTTLDLNNIDFWNRIRFTLNLHKLVPRNFIKEYLF